MKSEMIPSAQFSVSEVSIAYHPKYPASSRPQIDNAQTAYHILLDSWSLDKLQLVEQFKVMLLSHANRVLGIYELSSGGCTSTVVDMRLIYAVALKANAKKLVLAHNHPSGTLTPSQADIRVTSRIQEVGKLLDIQVVDHLIITAEGYYSFGTEGLL